MTGIRCQPLHRIGAPVHLVFRLTFMTAMMWGTFLGSMFVFAQEIPPLLEPEREVRTLGVTEFPVPIWMAVISDGPGARFLAREGEPIFRSGDPRPVGVVRTVTAAGLTITLSDGGRVVRVLRGRPIPGAQDLVLRDRFLVKTLEYRHRVVPRTSRKILEGELYLVGVSGTRAILQRDTDPSPPPMELTEQRLAVIQIVTTGPRTWEVNAKDFQIAMESGEAIVTRALKESRIDLSRDWGVGLEVKTPIADVRVDSRGFLITSANLASRAGLQVGDRILGVNGVPIAGYGGLVRIYRQIKNDSSIRTVSLTIERNQQPLTLTYRVK